MNDGSNWYKQTIISDHISGFGTKVKVLIPDDLVEIDWNKRVCENGHVDFRFCNCRRAKILRCQSLGISLKEFWIIEGLI